MKTYLRTLAGVLIVIAVFTTPLSGNPALAGEADIVQVSAKEADGKWSFNVTVLHEDAGWDHYADKWDIVAPDGTILGTRILAHPHDNEQPFTRSISGIEIPESIKEVTIRAHDSVHEYGGKEVQFTLPR